MVLEAHNLILQMPLNCELLLASTLLNTQILSLICTMYICTYKTETETVSNYETFQQNETFLASYTPAVNFEHKNNKDRGCYNYRVYPTLSETQSVKTIFIFPKVNYTLIVVILLEVVKPWKQIINSEGGLMFWGGMCLIFKITSYVLQLVWNAINNKGYSKSVKSFEIRRNTLPSPAALLL